MTASPPEFHQALDDTASDLLAYFERRVAVREDAADLLGEVMLQAWRRVDAFPTDHERQRMWLFTIARNVLANHHRALHRRHAMADKAREALRTSECREVGEDVAVRDAVRRLPARQRELVMLVHWDRFRLAEAAELLGINASTARSRYAAARAALQRALAEPAELVTAPTA